ncbi:MAG TPA: hypothetical protein PK364_05570 [Synergistaceae bacterium]|nr:hypothetical protein [Synergistaceae bacterium]HPJ26124.1 hypothetical protein [Synergistaceae bacterium]HPQ36623.1 hypothetical protein [Synergistaceae bacterium]
MEENRIRAYLEEKFPRDPGTGALEVRLRFSGYEDLFEPLDGSPYGEKSLSSALVRVFLHLFEEIPLEYPYVLVFELPEACRDTRMEERCAKDFSRWCGYRSALARRKVRKNTKETLLYACIAAVLIGASLGVEKYFPSTMLGGDLLDQALTVGWWIFAWQAGSNVLLNWGRIRDPLRQFARLRAYPVRFEYV